MSKSMMFKLYSLWYLNYLVVEIVKANLSIQYLESLGAVKQRPDRDRKGIHKFIQKL